MLRKEITYTDFDGNERTETFMFTLTQPELVRLEVSLEGGLEGSINEMIEKKDGVEIVGFFERVISMSYGEKSDDGRFFEKSEALSARFMQSAAYSQLFTDLLTDTDAATAFFSGVIQVPTQKPQL